MRFILAILFAIGLIGLIIVLVIKGGDNDKKQQVQRIDVAKYATTDASVRMSFDGRIVAESEHRSYRITVNRQAATIEVFGGYQNSLLKAQTYPNNQTAYTSFVKSLDKLGYTNIDSTKPTDERGYCPQGQRYVYEIIQDSRDLYRAWGTSCGSSQGNFKGRSGDIRNLFQGQIPDYSKLLIGVNVY